MTKHMSETLKEVQKVEEKVEVDIDFEANVEELGDDATLEDLKKQNQTLTAQKKHWRDKAQEAGKPKEEKKPEEKPEEKKEETQNLSQTDLYTLIKADVPEEDLSEVTDYAKMKGISVGEALKSDVVQTILDTKKEKRTVADATNTGKTNQTKAGVTDEQLLANSDKGELPESDADMSRLTKLRLNRKK